MSKSNDMWTVFTRCEKLNADGFNDKLFCWHYFTHVHVHDMFVHYCSRTIVSAERSELADAVHSHHGKFWIFSIVPSHLLHLHYECARLSLPFQLPKPHSLINASPLISSWGNHRSLFRHLWLSLKHQGRIMSWSSPLSTFLWTLKQLHNKFAGHCLIQRFNPKVVLACVLRPCWTFSSVSGECKWCLLGRLTTHGEVKL